jgi:hypothetical protein
MDNPQGFHMLRQGFSSPDRQGEKKPAEGEGQTAGRQSPLVL